MKKLFFPLIFFLTITLISSKGGWGFCPSNIALQPNFNFSKYVGNWYEIAKSKSVTYLEKGSCGIDHKTKISDNVAHVQFTEIVDDDIRELNQTLTCEDGTAQCYAKFSSVVPAGDYKVIATDYVNYTMVYSCIGMGIYHFKLLWIMGREVMIEKKTMEKLKVLARGLGFEEDDLVMEDVSTCDLYDSIKNKKNKDL